MTGSQHTRVRDLARMAGRPRPDRGLRQRGRGRRPPWPRSRISTPRARRARPRSRSLLMDGGTWDTIIGERLGRLRHQRGECLHPVPRAGRQRRDRRDIIYFLMPELPGIPGVAALRPLVQQACAQSTVPCHFLDLQTIWASHPEYTAAGNVPFRTKPAPWPSATRSGRSCSTSASRSDDCVIESPLHLHLHNEPTCPPRDGVQAGRLARMSVASRSSVCSCIRRAVSWLVCPLICSHRAGTTRTSHSRRRTARG